MPAPRLSKRDRLFQLFAARAAQLICTTPEFDDLRKTVEADLGLVITPATDQDTRAQLRAELDGMVAHLYGLSQDEFAHVLSTFPLVAQATKDAALAEYAKLADDAEFQQAVAQAIESQAALRANAAAAPVAPASPVTLASDEAEPPQLPAPDTASRRAIDDFSKDELMAAVRDAFDAGNPLTRDEVVRGAARALGFERAGARIAEVLDDAIRTAVRRGFVEREGEALRLFGKALDEWDRDWVKDQFLAAIGRAWIEREDAIKAFSLWLGYRRVGSVFEEVTRSVMNGLIREGRLEGRGNAVRRLG
jgi:multidrug efflux pump subunit AcrA (membrane-fusion protein)